MINDSQKHSTLIDIISLRARTAPEQPAVIFPKEILTYRELHEGINCFASNLSQSAFLTQDRVLISLPNSSEFFFAFYGVMLAGGIPVPLFPDSGLTRLLSIAKQSGASAIITSKSFPADMIDEFNQRKKTGKVQLIPISKILAMGFNGDVNFPIIKSNNTAYIQYTSGSTSDPKGVKISHQNLLTNIQQMIAGFKINQGEVFVSWLPAFHDMGLILMTMVPFYLGTKLILLQSTLTNIRHWLEAIQEHRGTFTAAPDFAYRLCLTYVKDTGTYDISSLRVALNAAEPVRLQTIRDFEKRFGLTSVMTPAYGLSEATVGVTTWPVGRPIKSDHRGFVSAGYPFPDVTIKIREDSRAANREGIGEILVKSPANTKGYWNNSEATEKLYTDDSYLNTGDLGYIDDEGCLFIVGRKKNIIIQGGRNIAPKEIEELIDPLPFVRSTAAVGVDSGGREGEQVFIFVDTKYRNRPSEEVLMAMSMEITMTFSDYFGFRPGRVLLLKRGSLPYTANRKLKHGELRHKYLNGTYRQQGNIFFPDY
jgi:acyl-CoA synthetase (AMP-forming)/AMP-acid ligase II